LRLVFWIVAGLPRKDEEFWKYICEYDFISLSKTWLDDKGWDRLKDWLLDSHEWEGSVARKEKTKVGRRGLVTERRKG